MKLTLTKLTLAVTTLLLISCGGKERKDDFSKPKTQNIKETVKKEVLKKEEAKKEVKASEMVDLSNKGIGPIKSVDISKPINTAMAEKGKEAFKNKCSACHRVNKRFIGPNPTGILKRRSPEWVMNMIMNPEEMTQKDPIAKQLLVEFNGSPMANQNMSKEDTRAILEYFRTLK